MADPLLYHLMVHPEKDIGIQKIKKTSFGLEVSVI
jgi:hypothetical protein